MLPDLPLHGDSEDRPRHPYTLDWFAEVIAGFSAEVLGPRPLLAGHDAGAEILLRAVELGWIAPSRLVLMPNRLHAPPARGGMRAAVQISARPRRCPASTCCSPTPPRPRSAPSAACGCRARGNPAAADLVRHAFADVPGNSSLARSWARAARNWPRGAQRQLLDLYPRLRMPVLLLWADSDRMHPLAGAEEALELLPNAQLRVLASTGFLIAYDDPVGLARELSAFCG